MADAPKPQPQFPLRALTTGELADRIFTIYRLYFIPLFLLGMLMQLAPFLWSMLTGLFNINLKSIFDDPATLEPSLIKFSFFGLSYLGATVLASPGEFALVDYISCLYLGKEASLKESFQRLLPRLTAITLTTLLVLALIFLAVVPTFAVLGVGLYWTVKQISDAPEKSVLTITATLLGVLISFIPVVLIAVRLLLVMPAQALEYFWGWKALKRSSELVTFNPGKGFFYWGAIRLSLLYLPIFFLQMLAYLLVVAPEVVYTLMLNLQNGGITAVNNLPESLVFICNLLHFITSSLIAPLYVLVATLFYYDIRIRREGFDLEYLARTNA